MNHKMYNYKEKTFLLILKYKIKIYLKIMKKKQFIHLKIGKNLKAKIIYKFTKKNISIIFNFMSS